MTSVIQAPEGLISATTTSVANATDVEFGKQLLDFNSVIQELLNKESVRLNQLNAVIRCDTLPHIYISEKDIRQLCDLLIVFILQYPLRRSKLFFYIKCNPLESKMLPAPVSGWLHLYEICFYANSCNAKSWQATHEWELSECVRICSKYSGAFVSDFSNDGCLFKLTLFGKLY